MEQGLRGSLDLCLQELYEDPVWTSTDAHVPAEASYPSTRLHSETQEPTGKGTEA